MKSLIFVILYSLQNVFAALWRHFFACRPRQEKHLAAAMASDIHRRSFPRRREVADRDPFSRRSRAMMRSADHSTLFKITNENSRQTAGPALWWRFAPPPKWQLQQPAA